MLKVKLYFFFLILNNPVCRIVTGLCIRNCCDFDYRNNRNLSSRTISYESCFINIRSSLKVRGSYDMIVSVWTCISVFVTLYFKVYGTCMIYFAKLFFLHDNILFIIFNFRERSQIKT